MSASEQHLPRSGGEVAALQESVPYDCIGF
jgi:hypothetical protein